MDPKVKRTGKMMRVNKKKAAQCRTRRERPKSAPYLRFKNIQGTTIVKIWKKKFFKKIIFEIFFEKKVFFKSQNAEKNPKGGPFGHVRLCMFP